MAEAANYDQVSVISPNFCFPHPINLSITEKLWQISDRGSLFVNDVNGNGMFKVEKSLVSIRNTRVIRDAAGVPIATLRRKKNELTWAQAVSVHSEWKVFRGESTNEEDLIFKDRRSLGWFQIKTIFHVFMANNTSEDVCDYTVRGSGSRRSCQVCVGDSSTVIAQVVKKTRVLFATGKDKYLVTVHPNVDCAFIVALIAIFDSIKSQQQS